MTVSHVLHPTSKAGFFSNVLVSFELYASFDTVIRSIPSSPSSRDCLTGVPMTDQAPSLTEIPYPGSTPLPRGCFLPRGVSRRVHFSVLGAMGTRPIKALLVRGSGTPK